MHLDEVENDSAVCVLDIVSDLNSALDRLDDLGMPVPAARLAVVLDLLAPLVSDPIQTSQATVS